MLTADCGKSLRVCAIESFPFLPSDVDAERLLTVRMLIEYISDKIDGSRDLFEDYDPVVIPPPKDE